MVSLGRGRFPSRDWSLALCFPDTYLLITHHVVLERSSIKLYMTPHINMFLIAGLLLISKSSLGYSTELNAKLVDFSSAW